ncbi:unnamed protein product, partial [Nesidiocoris tenuis]
MFAPIGPGGRRRSSHGRRVRSPMKFIETSMSSAPRKARGVGTSTSRRMLKLRKYFVNNMRYRSTRATHGWQTYDVQLVRKKPQHRRGNLGVVT